MTIVTSPSTLICVPQSSQNDRNSSAIRICIPSDITAGLHLASTKASSSSSTKLLVEN